MGDRNVPTPFEQLPVSLFAIPALLRGDLERLFSENLGPLSMIKT